MAINVFNINSWHNINDTLKSEKQSTGSILENSTKTEKMW